MTNEEERPKTLLILAQAFPPDNISGAARPARFAKYLPAFGYSPIVVTAASQNGAGAQPFAVEHVPGGKAGLWERCAAWSLQRVQRYALPYNDYLPWSAHAAAAASRILRQQRVALVLSTSPPLATHLAALWLKRRHKNIKWIADFRDPLYGNPFRTRKWIFPYDRLIEKRIFNDADVVIANTDAVADLWRERYPEHAGKVILLWNGFDPDDHIAAEVLPARPYRVITHTGTLYGGRSPQPFLDSIRRLLIAGKLEAPAIRIRLIGPMDQSLFEQSKETIAALEAQGCLEIVKEMVPQQVARAAALESDFLLLLDFNETGASLQVPAKVFEYIRIGRPILAFTQAESPVERILAGSGISHRCLHADTPPHEMDRAIADFLNGPAHSSRPSQYFEDQFNGRLQTRYLCTVLTRLLEPVYQGAREGQPA